MNSHEFVYSNLNMNLMQQEEQEKSFHDNENKLDQQHFSTTHSENKSSKSSKLLSFNNGSYKENEGNDTWSDWEWNESNLLTKSSAESLISSSTNQNVMNDFSSGFLIDQNDNFCVESKRHTEQKNIENRSHQYPGPFIGEQNEIPDINTKPDYLNQDISNYFISSKPNLSLSDCFSNDHSFSSPVYVSQAKPVSKPPKQFASPLPSPDTPGMKKTDSSVCLEAEIEPIAGSTTLQSVTDGLDQSHINSLFSVERNTGPQIVLSTLDCAPISRGMPTFPHTDDRDQYLLTSHLSDANFDQDGAIQEVDSLPPPGLSRLVLGQPELNSQKNERLVPGTENSTNIGLRRQVDGEDTKIGLTQQMQRLSFEAPDKRIEKLQLSSISDDNDVNTDRNSYLVTGESTDLDQRIVPGLESLLTDANTKLSVHVREIEMDGENLEDKQIDREQIHSHSPTKTMWNEIESSELADVKNFSRNSTENESESSRTYNKYQRIPRHEKKRKQHEIKGRIASRNNPEKFDMSSQEESVFSVKYSNWIERGKTENKIKYQNASIDEPLAREKGNKRKSKRGFNNISIGDVDCQESKEKCKQNNSDQSGNRADHHSDRDIYYGYHQFKKNIHRFDHNCKKRRDSGKRQLRPLDNHHQNEKPFQSGYDDCRGNSSRTTRESDFEKEYNRERKSHFSQNLTQYSSNYNYDPYAYYYEQIFRTNPQVYSEWYKRYYCFQNEENANDGRQSVHSGRSSVKNEKKRENDQGLERETNPYKHSTISLRSTPSKFVKEHPIASFSSNALVLVKQSFTSNKTCNIISLNKFDVDDLSKKQLKLYPGPLIRGATHKTTIIEFCEEQIKMGPSICMAKTKHNSSNFPANQSSFFLLWRLLILLLRQNGMVVGADISELLMNNQAEYPFICHKKTTESSQLNCGVRNQNKILGIDNKRQDKQTYELPKGLKKISDCPSEDAITEEFRNLLLHGKITEALRLATDNNLWGHALFLASKMDQRSHAEVMLKFANKLPLNDPLQTLYQLMSGRKPSSVTSLCDENWGDWRPHLSMILSNSFQKAELNQKSIIALGETLFNRGDFYAAQFCYIMAQIIFEKCRTESSDSTQSYFPTMLLFGSSKVTPFIKFVKNEAIMMTEIYEYACSLNDEYFSIPELQPYKYLLATRMLDHGYQLKCLIYLEQIALEITCNFMKYNKSFVKKVYTLAERLKIFDPIYEERLQNQFNAFLHSDEEQSQEWLKNLRTLVEGKSLDVNASKEEIKNSEVENLCYQQNNIDQQFIDLTMEAIVSNPLTSHQSEAQFVVSTEEMFSKQTHQMLGSTEQNNQSEKQTIYNPVKIMNQDNIYMATEMQKSNICNEQTDKNPNASTNVEFRRNEGTLIKEKGLPFPTISLPNSSSKNYGFSNFNSGEFCVNAKDVNLKKNNGEFETVADSECRNQTPKQGSSWFGGIFNKLSLMPKNQMILPDDKNPVIVWDAKRSKWVNRDNEIVETENVKPPPINSDTTQKLLKADVMFESSEIPLSSIGPLQHKKDSTKLEKVNIQFDGTDNFKKEQKMASNFFKMQRGRSAKSSYVDVFNTSTQCTSKEYELVLAPPLPPATVPFSGILVPGAPTQEKCNSNS